MIRLCEYTDKNMCKISGEICPFMYFCTKRQIYKPLNSMPKSCHVKINVEVPDGYYRVREERKGYLYVDINEITYKILNPFDSVPKYVKATKTKNGWRLKKYKAGDEG